MTEPNTNHELQATALGAALLTLYHAYGSDTSLEAVQSRLSDHVSRHVCEPEAQIDRVTIILEPAHDVLAYALEQIAELLTGAPCKSQPPSAPKDTTPADGRTRIAHDLRAWLVSADWRQGPEAITMSADDGAKLLQLLSTCERQPAENDACTHLLAAFHNVCPEYRVEEVTEQEALANGCRHVIVDGGHRSVPPTHVVFDPDGDVQGGGLSASAAMADAIYRTYTHVRDDRDNRKESMDNFRHTLRELTNR